MNFVFQFFELFATFTEGLIVLSVPTLMCSRRYDKRKNIIFTLLFALVYTAIVSYMNTLSLFSFSTITVAILYSLIVNYITSKGTFLLRTSSLMITWFFLHSLDYVITYSLMAIFSGSLNASDGLMLILGTGIPRVIFLLIDKIIQIIMFFSFRRTYPKIQLLNQRNLGLILTVSTGAYILMSVLTGLIITDLLITIQIAAIFSIFFIVLSLVTTVAAVSVNSRYEKEKHETELMIMTNKIMQENFQKLQNSQNTIRQQVHDFKNHIRTINGMLEPESKAKEYIKDLLAVSYEQSQYCNCGNNVIDSVINCKAADAKRMNIPFEYRVTLSSPLYISSVDICAILANQIDNALEAAVKTDNIEKRYVKVEIRQKESFVFFKVTNSCKENPFNEKGELVSTKNDPTGIHGYGIRNIIKTVERYGGTLKSDYADSCFMSVAMLSNNK